MAKIRSNDEPVEKMAKLMAELYYFMAKEIIENVGEESGKKVIRSAIKNFGEARLKSMHEEAFERKLDISPETYVKVRDMPGISWKKDANNPNDIIYCPMQDMWKDLEDGEIDSEIGSLYCEIDDVLYKGFNAELERPLCKTKGDHCCRFIVKPKVW